MIKILLFTAKFLFRTLFLILFASMSLIYYLGETNAGLQTIIQITEQYSPLDIQVGHIEGKLFSAFSLENIKYRSKTLELNIKSIKFNWNIAGILDHKFIINDLEMNHIIITTHTSQTPKKDEHLKMSPSLKFIKNIVAKKIIINELVLIQDQDPIVTFEKIQLEKIDSNQTIFYAKTNYVEVNGKFLSDWTIPPTLSFQISGKSTSPNAMINFEGTLAKEWNLHWNIHIPELAKLSPKSHGSIVSSGKMTGPRFTPTILADIKIKQLALAKQKIKNISGKINLTIRPLTYFTISLIGDGLVFSDQKIAKINLDIKGTTQSKQNDWVTQFIVNIAKIPYGNARLTIPKMTNADNYFTVPIMAQVKLNFPDIYILRDYTPYLNQAHGGMQGTLEIKGTLEKPDIQGDIKLSNGKLQIPELGIAPNNINLHIYGDLKRHITYKATFKSGLGYAEAQGTTDFTQKSLPTEIRLQGNNLQVLNLPDYNVIATPDLKLHINNLHLLIDGNLIIPNAKITPRDFRQAIVLSEDVVFVGDTKGTNSSITQLLSAIPSMKINLKLNNVLLHYQDLKTTLIGELKIQTSPQTQPLATGFLYAKDGTYYAYGQLLKIKVGRLNYTGGLISNPGLNIKATREINTINTSSNTNFSTQQTYAGSGVLTVGIQILGTMEKPKILLISSKDGLSQDNILSYLVLGIPRSQASISDSLAILNASSALNLNHGSASTKILGLKQKLQNGLGLAELNIEKVQNFDPTANQNTGGVVGLMSLVVGKKLTKNAYAQYSVSLFNSTPISILNLRYQINTHWSVQSQSSTLDNGADLLYSIEKG